jgi:hypothetical protein
MKPTWLVFSATVCALTVRADDPPVVAERALGSSRQRTAEVVGRSEGPASGARCGLVVRSRGGGFGGFGGFRGSAVREEVAWVEEDAFVCRADDEACARLELPVTHDVGWDRHGERAALAPEARGETDDEPAALRPPEPR